MRETVNEYLFNLKKGEDCLNKLIDYSRGYINCIAYKYLSDKTLAEDVVYSVYDRVLHSIQSFDQTKNGLAWIVKITQNEAYYINNSERRQKYNILRCVDNQIEFDEDRHLFSFTVEKAMDSLEKVERDIIEYKVFMCLTLREIALITDIPKSTVAYKLQQAFNKLKEYLSLS